MKKHTKLAIILILSMFFLGCSKGGDGGSSPTPAPTPPTPTPPMKGIARLTFDRISTCPQTVQVNVDAAITGDSFDSRGSSGFQPAIGGILDIFPIPADKPLVLTVEPSENFVCGGVTYHYPAYTQNFTLTTANPGLEVHIAATRVTVPSTQSNFFHFAAPGENSQSSKLDGGKLSN